MRILLHDYSGHAFLVQLARQLAHDGHEVLHVHFPGFQTPKGALVRRDDDPPNFTTRGLALPGAFAKYSYVRRFTQELAYGRLLAETITAWRPEIVFSANSTLDPQHAAWRAARRLGVPFIFWVQDINSVAIARILARKLPVIGHLAAARYTALEKKLLRGSARAIVITEDFVPILVDWGVAHDRIDVVENWAPREDLPQRARDNAWARAHDLADKLVFLYSGTIGLKHDPGVLLETARALRVRKEARVVVVSEGIGADWLRREGAGLENLKLLPYQPFERLAEVVASGDVLMAVLEPDAGVFSVPSKVLTYLCAGRPLLAAMPPENLAARIIMRERAGLVVPAGDRAGFVAAASRLADDPALRATLGRNGLAYADRSFDIRAVAARIAAIARRALAEQTQAPNARHR
jgi:colanic acid biosynthesis glycosyl transferase WcaI